jgi:hypothetical protein
MRKVLSMFAVFLVITSYAHARTLFGIESLKTRNGGISSTGPLDVCSLVLKDGVFDIITDEKHSTSEKIDQSFYCSKDFEEYVDKRKDTLDIGFTFKGMPFKFGGGLENDNEFKKLREVCSGSYSKVSTEDFRKYASKQADHAILNAWTKCIEQVSTANIVAFTADMNGSIITIRAMYHFITGLANPVIDELVSIGSVECKPTRMVKGKQIPAEGITDYCIRKDKGEAAVILRTNYGDYTIQIERDHSGEVVGTYRIKTNIQTKSFSNLGRVVKTFRTKANGPCNNNGCQQTPFEDWLVVDEPFFPRDAKIDSCTTQKFVSHMRAGCEYPASGGFHFELAVSDSNNDADAKLLRPQQVYAHGINGSLNDFYEVTYSAEKWRLDISNEFKYSDPVDIKAGEQFTIVIKAFEKAAVLELVMNNKAIDIDPKTFQTGFGLKKIKEDVSEYNCKNDSYTFVTINS